MIHLKLWYILYETFILIRKSESQNFESKACFQVQTGKMHVVQRESKV